MKRPKQQVRWPWDPVDLPPHEISAIKAIAAQHPVGFKAIVEKIAHADRMSFTAGGLDGPRASDFAEGQRWVGNTLRLIVTMKLPSNASADGAPPPEPAADKPA